MQTNNTTKDDAVIWELVCEKCNKVLGVITMLSVGGICDSLTQNFGKITCNGDGTHIVHDYEESCARLRLKSGR